jgi:hypothetical protein
MENRIIMKPLGLTPLFKVIIPSKVEDKIWEAVEEAISSGWSPRQFKIEAANAWEHRLKEDAKYASEEFIK